MEPTIYKFVFRHSMRQQLFLVLITLIAFPFLYLSLDLPKTIINQAIGGTDFPRDVLIGLEMFGARFGADVRFGQIGYLMLLCAIFLILVFVNGGFKYWINVSKGQLGERMLRRLRFILFSRILRFPLPHFRKTSQGELIAMVTAEVEPMGGFIGDAVAQPVFQGGTLITILAFIMIQDPILGVAAIALYPLQGWLIPKMQKKVNMLAKQRVQAVRKLSERIGEAVAGIEEIHAHDASELELADFSSRVGAIFGIRYDIYRRKFMIKFLNNFIAQMTPFLFFAIGGYMVIQGTLTFGALVAVLAAYKDLNAPWKELLRYYQQKEDIRIKYEQLMEQFHPAGMLDESQQQSPPEKIVPLSGPIVATNLSLEEEGGIRVVEGATFSIESLDSTAVVGPGGSGGGGIAQLLARLTAPTSGTLNIGGQNLETMHEAVTGRRISYAGESAYLFAGSLRDNLLYGLKHQPVGEKEYDSEGESERKLFIDEANASGNTTSDLQADWIDYAELGLGNHDALMDRVFEVLRAVQLDNDIYGFGLQGVLDPAKSPQLTEKILEVRKVLHERLKDPKLSRLVEPFERSSYNTNMTVAENLLFGTPIGDGFDLDHLAGNPYVTEVLDKVGLTQEFLETGAKLGEIMVELFQDLPAGHQFFERYSFISADELDEYQQTCRHAQSVGMDGLETEDRNKLISLAFKLIPARHHLGLVEEGMQNRILEARHVFAGGLPGRLKASVAFFDASEYNAASSVQDNILFGRLVYGRPQSRREVGKLIGELVESHGLFKPLMDLGLEMFVGIGGGRLSVGQRQRLAIARCLLKRPDILIINAATASLDPGSQKAIMENVFKDVGARGLIWVLHSAEDAKNFNSAIVMEDGKVLEHGLISELNQPGRPLHKMAAAQ